MYKQETIQKRVQMAKMHDDMLEKLAIAMKKKNYVEASWLCYSIFEQRTTRMIEKHIHKCPRQHRSKDDKNAGINTRLICITKLAKKQYGGYKDINYKVFSDINSWCYRRNKLVHALLDVDTYKEYDKEFKQLAVDGETLVKQVYQEAAVLREWCKQDNTFGKFPEIKCRCKKQRCIVEEE